MQEAVNHPSYYKGENNPYEAIKVIEAWDLNFNLGSVLKYIARAGHKESGKLSIEDKKIEDLRKASWYINREIEKLKNKKGE